MFSFSKSSEAAPGVARWWWLSCAYGAVLVVVTGYFLVGIPIQLTDSYGNMLALVDSSVWATIIDQLYTRAYLRPLLWGQLQAVYDLSGGNYFAWFRLWHVGQLALLVWLFLRLVRPRNAADAAAVPVGLAALIGIHTFAGTVREAFPINTFMTILICCFAAADLALAEPRWWRTLLAPLLFAFAALTVESGLLVMVIFVTAFAVGARGVSWRGIAAVVALTGGYFYLRFVYLQVGAPDLVERSSGFGFATLSPADLTERFGASPIGFYAYNVMSSIGSVLMAEPRAGVFVAMRDLFDSELRRGTIVNVLASTLGTLFIAGFAWQRRREWLARLFSRQDQLVILFAVVTVANAVLSYAYTKDVIMSPAGAFFAVALAVALAPRLAQPPGALALVMIVVLSSAWAVRLIGAEVGLRIAAINTRNEWAYADHWFETESTPPTEPAAIRLKEQLQGDAISRHPMPPMLVGDWLEWFEEE